MAQVDVKLQYLKDQLIENMLLVRQQLAKSRKVFLHLDRSLAEEVMHYENRVNASELSIEKDCEAILSLYKPQSINLRFVLAALKINNQLERIGDHAYGIAKIAFILENHLKEEVITDVAYNEMFDIALSMMDDTTNAFNFEDSALARQVFKKDEQINEINRRMEVILDRFNRESPEDFRGYLYLFSAMKKVERIGDLAKNIAEETIYYVDAKILRHTSPKD